MSEAFKKKVEFQGLTVHVDRPKGFVQKGKDRQGTPWERTYHYDYGFLPNTAGGDGEGIDVFLGPDEKSGKSFWVTQKKGDSGKFDEYKVFLGFSDQAAAKKAYLQHTPEKFFGGIDEISVAAIRALLNKEPMAKVALAAFSRELEALMALPHQT